MGSKSISSSDARVASVSASDHAPRSLATSARLTRHIPGNGDSGGSVSHQARAASLHWSALRTSAISRQVPMTLQ